MTTDWHTSPSPGAQWQQLRARPCLPSSSSRHTSSCGSIRDVAEAASKVQQRRRAVGECPALLLRATVCNLTPRYDWRQHVKYRPVEIRAESDVSDDR